MNRDLTKAYLRQIENQNLLKAKGGALPEQQIKMREQDEQTFDRVSSIFDEMMRTSKTGRNLQRGATQYTDAQTHSSQTRDSNRDKQGQLLSHLQTNNF